MTTTSPEPQRDAGPDGGLTTGQVAGRLGMAPSTLRYYEDQFARWLEVPRNSQNQRVYSAAHVETFRTIRRLLDEDLYTIEGARRFLGRRGQADPLHLDTRAETTGRLVRALEAVDESLAGLARDQRELARRLASLQRSQLLLIEAAQRGLRTAPTLPRAAPAPIPVPGADLHDRLQAARRRLRTAAPESPDGLPPPRTSP